MLRKSAYTQLRSNIVVETDGETGGQPEELMVFPTTQQYALKDARYLISGAFRLPSSRTPHRHLPQFLSHCLLSHLKYLAQCPPLLTYMVLSFDSLLAPFDGNC